MRWRNAKPDTGRWQDWLRNLVVANNGRFRVLVFTVTPQPFSTATTTRQISPPAAEALLSKGLNVLPPELADQRCPPNCRVTVLVYEYTKAEGAAKSAFVKESSVPAETQLRNTTLLMAVQGILSLALGAFLPLRPPLLPLGPPRPTKQRQPSSAVRQLGK